jgi:hypothetical protein
LCPSPGERQARRRRWLVLAGSAAFAGVLAGSGAVTREASGATAARERARAVAEREPVSNRPTVEACFDSESYRPGTTAMLLVLDRAKGVTLRLFRVGDAHGVLRPRDVMRGEAVTPPRRLGDVVEGQKVAVPLARSLRSGLYFARLTAAGGKVAYAPFVLAPRTLGEHRIAVVLPTQSWQAYNFRDDDGNGTADTWYTWQTRKARLIRPFQNRGVPSHYHYYDEPFLRWLERNHYAVDFLSDAELRVSSGSALASAYELLIFEGHHEYVTESEYDAVTEYRDRGGNLMFLSGNNFYSRVTISKGVMTLVGRWREFGRPEAALVGVQWFLGCASPGTSGKPWIVSGSSAGRWIFRSTGLRRGSLFSSGGIEADRTAPSSPRGIQVVAEIPNVFGTGKDAQMTYYETSSGARVFAAGAFTLAGAIWQPPVRRVVANLIATLSQSDAAAGAKPAA